jgi:hypothetical protein
MHFPLGVAAVARPFGPVHRSLTRGSLVRLVTAGVVLSLVAAGLVGPASVRMHGVSRQPMVPVVSDSCGSGAPPAGPADARNTPAIGATVADHQEVVSPGGTGPRTVTFDSARVVVRRGR